MCVVPWRDATARGGQLRVGPFECESRRLKVEEPFHTHTQHALAGVGAACEGTIRARTKGCPR